MSYNRPLIFTAFDAILTSRQGNVGAVRDGGRAGEVQKGKSRKGKLNEKKILARQLTLKNIYAMA